ncbi:unnamed protein product [Cuscuta campestris]|uniref:FACT complex subunit n=1 Tax=Cuscuta campestris TaxID=132261 RepID=A0A484LDD0_9ASTE|nr:unnamed protein product [Cuscuta campestris]
MITELFKRRLSILYSSWRTDKDLWADSNILVICTRSQTSNLRSSQAFLWLFGQDLDDTAVVFTPYSIFFLCKQTSFSFMRTLVGCASALMKIPISVELMRKSDESPFKLGKIVRSVRARLVSGDLNRPLTVGYIDNEIPKLEFLVNDYAKYRIVNVSSGVANVISEGVHGAGEVHGSILADDMQHKRGIKRSITDRMDALKLTDDLLEESLGKPENPNQNALFQRFENMALALGPSETSCEKSIDLKITLNTLEKLEKVDKPSSVVDQVGNTQSKLGAETGIESSTLGKEFRKEVDDTDSTNVRDHFSRTTEDPEKFKLGWEVGAVINEKEAEQGVLRELKKKLTLFYSSWRKYRKELWGECDVLVISTPPFGPTMDTSHPSISSSFYRWLLGHEFPNTTAVFMDHTIHFVCPSEYFARLRSLGTTITNVARVSVSIIQKFNADAELELVDVALYALRKHQVSHQPVIIGYIDRESLKSRFLDSCGAKLDEQRLQAVNVISALVKLINEEDESTSLQRQCSDTAEVELELAENYQQMCLLNNNNAIPASLISNELQNDKFLKEDSKRMLVIQKGEETKWVLEEVDNKLPTQFAQVNISVEDKSDDLFPPIEDNTESELVVDEGKSSNAEQGVRPEKEQEYCGSNEDADWEIIEKQHDGQEPVIANNSSWTRWMGKAFSSVAQGRLS